MFQTGPEIHCDRADLDLGDDMLRSVRKIYGDADIQMQRTIAVIIRRFDIILPFDDLQILLPLQHPGNPVYIVNIACHKQQRGHTDGDKRCRDCRKQANYPFRADRKVADKLAGLTVHGKEEFFSLPPCIQDPDG